LQSANINHFSQDESGDFKDLNFKLTVLESLLNLDRFKLIDPYDFEFDADTDFGADVMPDFYGPYLPVLREYAGAPITDEELEAVEELYWDGGNAVFGAVAPNWDGEDDLFDVLDYQTDLSLLPNLKSFTAPFSDIELEKLSRNNPSIEFLQL
jgi:hypothetical protein